MKTGVWAARGDRRLRCPGGRNRLFSRVAQARGIQTLNPQSENPITKSETRCPRGRNRLLSLVVEARGILTLNPKNLKPDPETLIPMPPLSKLFVPRRLSNSWYPQTSNPKHLTP